MKKGFFIFIILLTVVLSSDSFAKKRSKKKSKVSRSIANVKNKRLFDLKLPNNWIETANTGEQALWKKKNSPEKVLINASKRYSKVKYKYIRNNLSKMLKFREKMLANAGITRFKLTKKKFFKAPHGNGIVLQMKGSYLNSRNKKTQFEEWQVYTKKNLYTLLFNRPGEVPINKEAVRIFQNFKALD